MRSRAEKTFGKRKLWLETKIENREVKAWKHLETINFGNLRVKGDSLSRNWTTKNIFEEGKYKRCRPNDNLSQVLAQLKKTTFNINLLSLTEKVNQLIAHSRIATF